MKWLLVVFIVFTAAVRVGAQTDSITVWNKWCARVDTPLLFPTANNLIMVHSSTLKPSELNIKSLDNALKIGGPELRHDTLAFMAMPYPKYGKRMRLEISNKKTRKVLKTVNFSAESVPQPVARLGSISGAEAKRNDVLAATVLRVAFNNSMYAYPYRVKQYTLKSRIAGRDILIPVKSALITPEVANILSVAPVGAYIEFIDIKATCPDCEERSLPNIHFWIR